MNNNDSIWIPTEQQLDNLRTHLLHFMQESPDTFNLDHTDIFLDSYGHVCTRSVDRITPEDIARIARWANIPEYTPVIAYAGSDIVTLSYDDAMTLYLLLEEVNQERGGDDLKSFGPNSLSFEKLYDAVSGDIYPIRFDLMNDPSAAANPLYRNFCKNTAQRRERWNEKNTQAWWDRRSAAKNKIAPSEPHAAFKLAPDTDEKEDEAAGSSINMDNRLVVVTITFDDIDNINSEVIGLVEDAFIDDIDWDHIVDIDQIVATKNADGNVVVEVMLHAHSIDEINSIMDAVWSHDCYWSSSNIRIELDTAEE